MNGSQHIASGSCLVEIGMDFLVARRGGRSVEVALVWNAAGHFEAECRQAVNDALESLMPKGPFHAPPPVICAIPARGVSLRKLSLPNAAPEALNRLLLLQIENEFPISPEDLAWGSLNISNSSASAAHQQHVLIAAIKRELLRPYRELMPAGNLGAVFTPAALARARLCPQHTGISAHLELGQSASELVVMEDGVPAGLRVVPWGISHNPSGAAGAADRDQGDPRAKELARLLAGQRDVKRIWITSRAVDPADIAKALSLELGIPCEPLQTAAGQTVAISGLAAAGEKDLPVIRLNEAAETPEAATVMRRDLPTKWAAAAALLVLLASMFPFLEAFVMKPRLEKQLAAIKADRGRLALIDSELEFLRHLKQNQAPYIDVLYMVARSVPPGARFESISLNRQGFLSVRGSMRDATQVAEFRSKLLDSGLFASVAVEEQSPSPDRQKLVIRMSAQWHPGRARELAAAVAAKEPELPKGPSSGGFPPGMPGMPPGVFPSSMAPPPGVVMMPPGATPAGLPPGMAAAPVGMPTAPGVPGVPAGIPQPGAVPPQGTAVPTEIIRSTPVTTPQ